MGELFVEVMNRRLEKQKRKEEADSNYGLPLVPRAAITKPKTKSQILNILLNTKILAF
jgi:hypothetical protein